MSQYEPKAINKGEEKALLHNETSTHKYRRNVGTRKSPTNVKTSE